MDFVLRYDDQNFLKKVASCNFDEFISILTICMMMPSFNHFFLILNLYTQLQDTIYLTLFNQSYTSAVQYEQLQQDLILQWLRYQFKSIQTISMEKKEQSFGEQLQQSQEQFRKQFDPTSENYHKGLVEVVPTGGSRVPDSMPTIYPEGFDPTKPQDIIDYGDNYREVEANRGVYQNLKKELAKLGPIVEAFLRHEQHFKTKGDPTNEQHKAVYDANIAKETTNLKAVQELLSAFVPVLEATDAEGKECAKELNEIIFESGKKYEDKVTLTDFNFKMKKLSAKTFSIAQKCLQKLKDIKKQYANKQKASVEVKQETQEVQNKKNA